MRAYEGLEGGEDVSATVFRYQILEGSVEGLRVFVDAAVFDVAIEGLSSFCYGLSFEEGP